MTIPSNTVGFMVLYPNNPGVIFPTNHVGYSTTTPNAEDFLVNVISRKEKSWRKISGLAIIASATTALVVELLLLLPDISCKENSWRKVSVLTIIIHSTTVMVVILLLLPSDISRKENSWRNISKENNWRKDCTLGTIIKLVVNLLHLPNYLPFSPRIIITMPMVSSLTITTRVTFTPCISS